MEIFKEIEPLRAYIKAKRKDNLSIGLVPTMGALHQGHLSLIQAAKTENQFIICSIYVNPAQFNNPSDLAKYPRSVMEDTKMLEKAGCQVLFLPENVEMYDAADHIKFDFGHLDKVLEGKYRPGHFSGVALVVSKLLNIVQPDNAYFGQKDYQQYQIILRLVQEMKFPVAIKSVPIVRDPSGLALSSRNQRLSGVDLEKATILFQSLNFAKQKLTNGEDFESIKIQVQKEFKKDEKLQLEYFELADKLTLRPISGAPQLNHSILLIAAYVNGVRLIDNLLLCD